jgi:hypothetical protein
MLAIEIIDKYGRRRRALQGEVPADGETVHFPQTFMDDEGCRPYFSDGKPDDTSPHRPGYRFADIGDAAVLAASEAYERKRSMLSYASRRRRPEDVREDDAPPRARTLDELRAAADAAYEDRKKRISWHTHD